MKEMEAGMKISDDKKMTTPPPPPPPLPSFWLRKPAPTWSATKEEIAMFWRRKKMVEEEHFLEAIKAAARKRAHNLSEEDYLPFEERLDDVEDVTLSTVDEEKSNENDNSQAIDERSKEIRIGIKDWWTKSKYAYLNLPATESTDKPKKTSTYIPHSFSYKATPRSQHAPLGVF